MKMKIAIGKIKGRLLFHRSSDECKRSSTNGHKSAYAIYSFILNNFNSDFVFVGDNDVCIPECKKADFGFFIAGMIGENESDLVIDYINENKNLKWILFADDPRTLSLVLNNKVLKNPPIFILSQFDGVCYFGDIKYKVKNIHQELTEFVGYDADTKAKLYDNLNLKSKTVINVLCNTSDSDRQKKMVEFSDYFQSHYVDFNVYGRIGEDVKGYRAFKGEVGFREAEEKLMKSYVTICMPIKENWFTSKYVECINNFCLPIFTNKYGKLQHFEDLYVENPAEAFEKFEVFRHDNRLFVQRILSAYFDLDEMQQLMLKNLKEVLKNVC